MRNLEHQPDHSPESPPPAIFPLSKWNHFKPWDRHGLILMVVGVVYILIGVSYFNTNTARMGEITINFLPGNTIYLGFTVVGAISMISARWPNKPRILGYTVLSAWTTTTASIYIYGGLELDNTALFVTGLTWALMAFLWWAISGLVSPPSERANRGVPSPHRDHCGGSDWIVSGSGYTAVFDESEPHGCLGVKPVRHGERSI